MSTQLQHQGQVEMREMKGKIEAPLRANNLGSAWDCMKTITGLKESSRKLVQLPEYNCHQQLSQSLKEFYVRFDVHDFSENHSVTRNRLLSAPIDVSDNEAVGEATHVRTCG